MMLLFNFMALSVLFLSMEISFVMGVLEGRRVLVVAGNFTLDGERVNIAQFDIHDGIWSKKYQAEVYLYGQDNGVISDLAINYTNQYDYMYAAGLFDTVSKTSQIQLCSVAKFDGVSFEKVGEGLCYRGIDTAFIHISTVVLAKGGDLFVGGNFATRVWDGHHFVYVYHVAKYDAQSLSWLPLKGGGELKYTTQDSTHVEALAWDDRHDTLYIGGSFFAVDNRTISSGLAMWSDQLGLVTFPGGGVSLADGSPGEVQALGFESKSSSLVVCGVFDLVQNMPCQGIAIWNTILTSWKCLVNNDYSFSYITAALLDRHMLYLAGQVRAESTWRLKNYYTTQYNIARLNLLGYIEETINIIESMDSIENENSNSTESNVTTPTELRRKLSPSRRAISARTSHRKQRLAKSSRRRLARDTRTAAGDWFGHATLSSNDSSNKHFAPTYAPTTAPHPWSVLWEWLPSFHGTNGPILKIIPGKRAYEGSLLISGQFSNYPPLLKWDELIVEDTNGYHHGGNITSLGGKHAIEGMISSLAEVYVPFEAIDTHNPPQPIPPPHDYTFVILLACVGVGILLGLGFTFSCLNKWSIPPEGTDYYDAADEAGSNNSSKSAFSLKTLCDAQGTVAVDFKEAFERAMKSRHLPTYEALVIINPKEILLSRIIGEGSFGRVWSGQWRNNAVAVKEFVFAQAAIAGGSLQRSNIIEEIVGEAGVMACLRHPKILQLYGCSLTMQAIWIVSELCIRGSLKMVLIEQTIDLPMQKKLSICMDIADGMQYLHNRSPPIIHRDLKSHNIFISEPSPGHFVAKIGDWGSARAVALTGAKNMTHGVGTACWLSPEVINNAHFSKYSDVYAFGIILWEVFTRQEIYEGLSAAQIIAKVANEGLRPNVPRDCPWNRIMTDCWKQEPIGRPSFQTILVGLSKIYLKLNASILKSKGIYQETSGGSISIGDEEMGGNGSRSELQPLLSNPPVDGNLISTSHYEALQGSQKRPPRSVPSSLPASPLHTKSRSVDSLENITLHSSNDTKEDSQRRNWSNRALPYAGPFIEESSAAHLAPEIASPAFIVTDENGELVNSLPSSKENSRTDSSFQYSDQAHPADPLDFLFASHQPNRARRQDNESFSDRKQGPNS